LPAPLITLEQLKTWILHEDQDLLVIHKPGDIVCHPSKQGPWSSLVGACREYTQLPVLHMPSRLDRETSGVVVFVKQHALASKLQMAIQRREVSKSYRAILRGRLPEAVEVDQPIGPAEDAEVWVRQTVRPDGAAASTRFTPLVVTDAYTLAEVEPRTGRLHQIRVHAEWLGHPVVGDKIYGGDPGCYLEFVRNGYTPALAEKLLIPRQALHCAEIVYRTEPEYRFTAPLPPDLAEFLGSQGIASR
jgi:23S rRNA pseudouridine1911/1915/1917 synthase